MKKQKKEELCIFQKGLNGDTTFSLVDNESKQPIVTNKGIFDIANHIIREYPEVAKRITEASKSLSGAETGDINFSSSIYPSHKEEIVNSIVIGFESKMKKSNKESV